MAKRLFVEVDVRQMKWTIKCAREAVGSSLRGAQIPRQRIQQSTRLGGGAAKGSALQQLEVRPFQEAWLLLMPILLFLPEGSDLEHMLKMFYVCVTS